jgi:hypothetical protein
MCCVTRKMGVNFDFVILDYIRLNFSRHFQLVLWLRMHGSVAPFPHTSSRGDYILGQHYFSVCRAF